MYSELLKVIKVHPIPIQRRLFLNRESSIIQIVTDKEYSHLPVILQFQPEQQPFVGTVLTVSAKIDVELVLAIEGSQDG